MMFQTPGPQCQHLMLMILFPCNLWFLCRTLDPRPGRADAHDAWAVARDAPDTADAHDALAVLGHRRTETVVFCALLLMKTGQDNLAVCLDDRAVAVMPRTPRRHQASTIDAHDALAVCLATAGQRRWFLCPCPAHDDRAVAVIARTQGPQASTS